MYRFFLSLIIIFLLTSPGIAQGLELSSFEIKTNTDELPIKHWHEPSMIRLDTLPDQTTDWDRFVDTELDAPRLKLKYMTWGIATGVVGGFLVGASAGGNDPFLNGLVVSAGGALNLGILGLLVDYIVFRHRKSKFKKQQQLDRSLGIR